MTTKNDAFFETVLSDPVERELLLKLWLMRAEFIAAEFESGQQILELYQLILSCTLRQDWRGACHDTSAAFYVLARELGLSPSLHIGIVQAPGGRFSHSWVEFDGKIFDTAICFPNENAIPAGPPIFGSYGLSDGEPHQLVFAVQNHPFDDPANRIAKLDLYNYGLEQDTPHMLWSVIQYLGRNIGLDLAIHDLQTKYGQVVRQIHK